MRIIEKRSRLWPTKDIETPALLFLHTCITQHTAQKETTKHVQLNIHIYFTLYIGSTFSHVLFFSFLFSSLHHYLFTCTRRTPSARVWCVCHNVSNGVFASYKTYYNSWIVYCIIINWTSIPIECEQESFFFSFPPKRINCRKLRSFQR